MLRPDWTHIAPRLRQARNAKALTAFQVAAQTGVREASLYHYERGTTEPSATTLLVLCAFYGIDPLSLVAA
jgi:transcriptional regulator with XRE-family HTH domain